MMGAVGPWEGAPHLAVAVSGGADSLALAHLTHEWADARGGRIHALTVDHGLRPESAAEARQTAARLNAAGIACQILAWGGGKPSTGQQAAARQARYRIMADWCAGAGILHLLVAHHAADQAETVVLRATAGSGFHGLAAMAGVVETRTLRVVRPLLGVAEARLRATVAARGGAWIDDPSNADRRFTRVRVRQGLASRGAGELGFAHAAQRIGCLRAFDERAVCALLARSAAVYPAGFAIVDPGVLGGAAPEIAERALGRALTCIGGRHYPPGQASLRRLRAAVVEAAHPRPRTLAGCRIVGWRGRLLICREAGRGLPRVAMAPGGEAHWLGGEAHWPGGEAHWDGRFLVRWPASDGARYTVAALGDIGWARIGTGVDPRNAAIPFPVLPSLPAFWDDHGVVAVPHLAYRRADAGTTSGSTTVACAFFKPNQPFVPPHFAVAPAPFDPI